ncbi:hypothetical protein ASG80_16300 [Agromyces sp. Soil535]|nr:hypothetical protein ASG80_16300 [Agromyces sp. Soil535]
MAALASSVCPLASASASSCVATCLSAALACSLVQCAAFAAYRPAIDAAMSAPRVETAAIQLGSTSPQKSDMPQT